MTDATPEHGAQTHRPALKKLASDQRTDVIEPLESGFASRAAVIRWLQQTSVRTLGRIPDAWFAQVALRPDLLDMLTGESREAALQRAMLADTRLFPVCHDAYKRLRKSAREYVNAEDAPDARDATENPEAQKFVAMRPSLHDLDRTQQRVIQDGLTGFKTREDLREWAHTVVEASEGLIPREYAAHCAYSPTKAKALLSQFNGDHPDRQAQVARETLLAEDILPRFNAGVRDLLDIADEAPQEERMQYAGGGSIS